MNSPRRLAGFVCIAAAFAIIGLLSMGTIDPLAGRAPLRGIGDVWTAMAPYVLGALALFLAGLALLRGGRA